MPRLPILAAALALAACDAGPVAVADPVVAPVSEDLPAVDPADVATMEAYEAKRSELRLAIRAAIETRAPGPQACWLLPVGKKACGGPLGYEVYSAAAPSAGEVLRLGRALWALDEAAHRALGLASDCSVPQRPGVSYRGGRCTALPPDGAPVAE